MGNTSTERKKRQRRNKRARAASAAGGNPAPGMDRATATALADAMDLPDGAHFSLTTAGAQFALDPGEMLDREDFPLAGA